MLAESRPLSGINVQLLQRPDKIPLIYPHDNDSVVWLNRTHPAAVTASLHGDSVGSGSDHQQHHELVQPAGNIDWDFLDGEIAPRCSSSMRLT